jgi:hypothetical protein
MFADAPALLDEQARVPGLAPWLQEAPVAAQVHARYLRDIRRQLAMISDERDFRIEHEVPALRAGRRRVLANLQRAQMAATATCDYGRAAVLQRAARRAEALILSDAQALGRLDAAAGIPERCNNPSLGADMCSEDGASAAGDSDGGGGPDWFAADNDVQGALQQLAEEEADAAAAAPFEPIRQDEADFVAECPPEVPTGIVASSAGVTAPRSLNAAAQAGTAQPTECGALAATHEATDGADSSITGARTRLQDADHEVCPAAGDSADLFAAEDGVKQLQLVETLAEARRAQHFNDELVVLTVHSVSARLWGEDFQALGMNMLLTTNILDFVSVMLQVSRLSELQLCPSRLLLCSIVSRAQPVL